MTNTQISMPTTWLNRPVPSIKQDRVVQPSAVETEPSTECPNCHTLTTNTSLIFNQYVCPDCDHHLSMSARKRLVWFFDDITGEIGQNYQAGDPLHFTDSKPYPLRMSEAQKTTGESEALIVMNGKIKNLELIACAFDFKFMGGSMGSVVGDRFVMAGEKALAERKPLVCFAASGGQECKRACCRLCKWLAPLRSLNACVWRACPMLSS